MLFVCLLKVEKLSVRSVCLGLSLTRNVYAWTSICMVKCFFGSLSAVLEVFLFYHQGGLNQMYRGVKTV